MDNTLDFSQQIMLKYSLLFYYNTNQSYNGLVRHQQIRQVIIDPNR